MSSIKCHFDELVCYLSTSNEPFDIIALSETWLTEETNFVIEGYQTSHSLGFF